MRNPFRRRPKPEAVARLGRLPLRRRIHRAFAAALPSLFRSSWTTTGSDINSEIFWALDPWRARSRDLAKNEPYFKRYLQLVKQNLVGPRGVAFQSRVKDPDGALDKNANDIIEAAWADWSAAGQFDVTGRLSRAVAEQTSGVGLARDGEFLWRIIRGFEDNRFNYAVQVLEPERLDIKKNEATDPVSGNRVVMGVELNNFARPIAYHLLGVPTNSTLPGSIDTLRSGEHVVVPAADIIHGYATEWPEQLRGIPWGHASMAPLNDLGGYREAALVNARVGAGKLGFWKTPSGEGGPADDITIDGAILQDAEPGEQRVVPDDWEFEKWDPTYPLGEFSEFNKHLLRGVSAGLNVFYPMLGQDIENVNLSSIRGGLQDDREGWMIQQAAFIEAIYRRLFPDWLLWSLTMGHLGELPVAQFAKFNAPAFQGRRWKSPDPLKDSQANGLDWGMRTRSLREIIRESGRDPDEVWEEIARDKIKLDELGIAPTLPAGIQFDTTEGPPEPAASE